MSNPLSAIDDIVSKAFTGFDPLIAVVPVSKIQIWDNKVDAGGEVEESPDLGKRIWIVPMEGDTDFNFSSSSVLYVRNYGVGFGTGTLAKEGLREIEWLLSRAADHLFNLLQPDGVTPIVQPTPLQIESIGTGRTDPERGPLVGDPEEWADLLGITVVAVCARSALNA